MAKKDTIGNIFQRTEPQGKTTLEKMVTKVDKNPLSVYLTAEEKNQLAMIAKELGNSKHALMQFAIKEFLRRYEAGEYEITTEKVIKKTIKPI